MSIESAQAFIEKMQTDSDFRERVVALKSREQRRSFINNEGYDFTKEEFEQAKQKFAIETTSSDGELSDEDLENVAGGRVGCYYQTSL